MSAVLHAVLAGQHPSGKNQIQMSAPNPGQIIRFPKRSFEEWRGTAYAQLDRQRGAWETLRRPARVIVRYTKGDLIKRDVPGMMDALCHLFEWCPLHGRKKAKNCWLPFVFDDSLLVEWHWTPRDLDRDNPRLELVIEPL